MMHCAVLCCSSFGNSMKKNEMEDEGAVAIGEALLHNVVLTELK